MWYLLVKTSWENLRWLHLPEGDKRFLFGTRDKEGWIKKSELEKFEMNVKETDSVVSVVSFIKNRPYQRWSDRSLGTDPRSSEPKYTPRSVYTWRTMDFTYSFCNPMYRVVGTLTPHYSFRNSRRSETILLLPRCWQRTDQCPTTSNPDGTLGGGGGITERKNRSTFPNRNLPR